VTLRRGESRGRRPPELEAGLRHRGEHGVEDVVRRALLRQRLVREHEAVSERVLRQGPDVRRDHVVASVHEGERPRAVHERDRPARARTVRDEVRDAVEPEGRRLARRGGEADRVADEPRVDVDALDRALQLGELLEREHLPHVDGIVERAVHDGQLFVPVRVADEHLEHEAVDLCLRERVRALGLDRILGRHHEERIRHEMRVGADRDLVLLHHLEERGLHLRRRAVDLVGEEEVAEHRAEVGLEPAVVRTIDARSDEVRRHEVGGELDAAERPAEHRRRRLDRERLREAGDALDQEVAARDEADEHALEHLVLTCDDALDLDERFLEPRTRFRSLSLDLGRCGHGRRLRLGCGGLALR
jgi:hypothetical protein